MSLNVHSKQFPLLQPQKEEQIGQNIVISVFSFDKEEVMGVC